MVPHTCSFPTISEEPLNGLKGCGFWIQACGVAYRSQIIVEEKAKFEGFTFYTCFS